jgi:hypothetical protein
MNLYVYGSNWMHCHHFNLVNFINYVNVTYWIFSGLDLYLIILHTYVYWIKVWIYVLLSLIILDLSCMHFNWVGPISCAAVTCDSTDKTLKGEGNHSMDFKWWRFVLWEAHSTVGNTLAVRFLLFMFLSLNIQNSELKSLQTSCEVAPKATKRILFMFVRHACCRLHNVFGIEW